MDRSSVQWRGYMPAVTTPFLESGELDWAGVETLLDWLVGQGMHGLAIAGTTGEWWSLGREERKELFRVSAHVVNGRVTLFGGCSAFTPAEVIEYAEAALEAGCDGLLFTPPPYVKPNEDEIVAFYRTVSDAIAGPICVYNWPRGTGIDMSVALQTRLAEIENVVGIKNSTERVDRFLEGFFALRNHVRYFGVPLGELGLGLVQHYDADGVIGAGGVLGPDQPNFFNHAWAGDRDAALRCAARDRVLATEWRTGFEPRFASAQAIMKGALNLRGLPGGYPRPPLLPLTDAQLDIVRSTLVRLELIDG